MGQHGFEATAIACPRIPFTHPVDTPLLCVELVPCSAPLLEALHEAREIL